MVLKRMPEEAVISIIVTSYSTVRLDEIKEMLDSIKKQTYHRIELIYVVERSELLLKIVEKILSDNGIPNYKLLFNDGEPGLAYARNLGSKEATGEIISFIDDDVLLPANWAEEMVKTYHEAGAIMGVTGPALPLWDDYSLKWLPEELYWIIGCTAWRNLDNLHEIQSVRTTGGMNMSFRRESFCLVGFFMTSAGFRDGRMPSRFIGEDFEFSMRVRQIGGRIVYNPRVKVYHRVRKYRFSWKFIADRAFWVGQSRPILKRYYSENLGMESDLLARMLKSFPDSIKRLFSNPVVGLKRVFATFMVLQFAALGYAFGMSLKYSSSESKAIRRRD